MLERFVKQTKFTSQEDFIKNFKVEVPENFNFGYDVVDAWAAENPEKKAILWTNDQGLEHQYNYAELKEKLGKQIFATPKKQGAETAEANMNAGLAAAHQICNFFVTGSTKFQVNK